MNTHYTSFPKYKLKTYPREQAEAMLELHGGMIGTKRQMLAHLKRELRFLEHFF